MSRHDEGAALDRSGTGPQGDEPGAGEQARLESERAIASELLSAVTTLMPDAAVVADTGGHIVAVNRQAEALFGYPPGTLAGVSIEALVPERSRARHRRHRQGYLASPASRAMGAGLELTGRRRDGSEFPIDVSLAPIAGAGEQLVFAAVRDVTEQRAATAAQSELATIVSSSLDAIISTSLEGFVTSWNPAAEALFGYPREEIVGQHIALLVPDDASVVLEELLDLAYEGSHQGARDTRWRHRDGHEVEVAVSISPLFDRSGAPRGFSSIVRDITERKRDEAELHRALSEEQRLEREHAAAAEIRLALLSGSTLEQSLALICERASVLLDAPVAEIRLDASGAVHVASAGGPRRSPPEGPSLQVRIADPGDAGGTLTLVRDAGADRFDERNRLFADSLAAQASLALEFERARKNRERLMLFSDRERIARDLHDYVIQRLFATGLNLQSSLSLIEEQQARERVSGAVDELDQAIGEIRSTIFSLSAPVAGDEGLRRRIMEVAQKSEETLHFPPSIRFAGRIDTGVPGELADHVLAVVHEALSNVARHARASAVRIEVVLDGTELTVTVTDDGIGISNPTRSSGLSNMKERAELLGGRLALTAAPGRGTRLEWRVPLGRGEAVGA